MKIRTLIVDDEPVARRRLKRLLQDHRDIEILGECGDGTTAVAAIQEQHPDLVFLDVQMPEMNGFEVLQAIRPAQMPVVIFVTAFDEFALKAFEAQVLDYVLKPVGAERLRQAIARASTHLQGRDTLLLHQRLEGVLNDARGQGRISERLLVKTNGRIVFLKPKEVDWIEAVGDYVKLHVGAESHLLRGTLGDFDRRLAPEGFARIHRSRLVNLDRVKEVRPMFQSESVVVLRTGERLPASKTCLKDLQARLGT